MHKKQSNTKSENRPVDILLIFIRYYEKKHQVLTIIMILEANMICTPLGKEKWALMLSLRKHHLGLNEIVKAPKAFPILSWTWQQKVRDTMVEFLHGIACHRLFRGRGNKTRGDLSFV